MTYYRSGLDRAYIFVCDSCGDEIDTGETCFEDAKDAFKDRGVIHPVRGGWEHLCEDCTDD